MGNDIFSKNNLNASHKAKFEEIFVKDLAAFLLKNQQKVEYPNVKLKNIKRLNTQKDIESTLMSKNEKVKFYAQFSSDLENTRKYIFKKIRKGNIFRQLKARH